MSDYVPKVDYEALKLELSAVRAERDEYKKALYAELWKDFTPPTEEELATAEPIEPWFSDFISRLQQPSEN